MKHFIKKILLTNDDGFNAIGLQVLKNIASKFCDDITVVSPKINQSAKSRSITLKDNVYFEEKNDWVSYLLTLFKEDLISVEKLGSLQKEAVLLAQQAGYK